VLETQRAYRHSKVISKSPVLEYAPVPKVNLFHNCIWRTSGFSLTQLSGQSGNSGEIWCVRRLCMPGALKTAKT
jgi:hypothetical protein